MMIEDVVASALRTALPDAEITVSLEGSHCSVTVVCDSFSGMRPVARQQKVYAPLMELISSGQLHAVNIDARTP
ncbi:MAG: BolA family transcriptional regulator [Halieaceae bacterium MED-G27]|jgi:acid stress-induced BolA-like protein IbaG/YrbA|nr:BolA family transcriptional regulator [Halieaceae bacterium]OUT65721.1 MAG: BolA family transcriptional regulator [Cellvibrionales bacterium TMED21]PDH35710.1 MAG: BolA family transcriptional regulator [Halieaceae bacterium MED-G27]|tara:strand:- start:11891 stop:12112 length:222 start_codon:yes stop_codon:yes gene_type:complete